MKLTANFNREEFDCHDGTIVPAEYLSNVKEVARNLQILRDFLGESIHVNSGFRTKAYNSKLSGSATNSQHLTASAADITVRSKTPRQLKAIVEKLIKEGKLKFGGVGLYPGFLHVDIRPDKARWGL